MSEGSPAILLSSHTAENVGGSILVVSGEIGLLASVKPSCRKGWCSCERFVPSSLFPQQSPGTPLHLRKAAHASCSKDPAALVILSAANGLSDNEVIYKYHIQGNFCVTE